MGTARHTIVVTGAGSGVGRAIALHFARNGWRVALVGRNQVSLDETAALCAEAAGGESTPFCCDVSRAEDVCAMSKQVLEAFGQVEVLVNCAGINVPHRSFKDVSLEDWQAVIETNLNGSYYCVRAFLPSMRERGAGTFIHINSDVGKRARDLAGPAYVASKFGLTGLSHQINEEERANGIRSCSIFPRDVNTPLLDKRRQPPPADLRTQMMQPEDIAAAVWLVATLPPRVIVPEIEMTSR
jgi:NAD(P)-dependent dehydrogenase (short-subunit alcohol dehydrogenase family)